MFKRILVCLDGSALSEQILPYVSEMALRFGSKITLLEITNPPTAVVEPLLGYYHATPLDKLQRDEKEASTYLEHIAARLRKKGIEVACVTIFGSPGESIVTYADKHKMSLIALCTHGHKGLGRLVFGSVAEFVLRNSEIPVLVRKPREINKKR